MTMAVVVELFGQRYLAAAAVIAVVALAISAVARSRSHSDSKFFFVQNGIKHLVFLEVFLTISKKHLSTFFFSAL